ncbi:MAG: trigger factor [Oscillospiraceae bacterium]|jgi:trigger factor|nr:trigger factor [Oscillospiraceae bacterium]
MYLKSSKNIDVNRRELEIEVSREEFNKAIDKIYEREKGRINVPGFRKGKAPRSFMEKYYGEEIFFEDAINSIYPDILDAAAKEADLELVDDKMDFELVSASKQSGLHFKVKVTVMPEVEIGNYKGIEVSKRKVSFFEEDLENELKEVQKKNGRLVTVENRPAKFGDIVTIDFDGTVDGEKFDGGSASNFALELGKKQFVGDFEEQIVGHSIGDEFEVNVTFPKNYHAHSFANKDAVFKVKLHEIKESDLPEIDDEFVKDISEFDTLDQYKEDLKQKIIRKKEFRAQDDTENEMIGKLIKLVKADVPEAMIKLKLNELMKDFEYRLQTQGIKLGDYLKYTGNNISEIEETFRPQAESHVKLSLALDKIAKIENIDLSENDISEEYNKIAKHHNMDLNKVKNIIPEFEIKKDIRSKKALDIVRNNSVVK